MRIMKISNFPKFYEESFSYCIHRLDNFKTVVNFAGSVAKILHFFGWHLVVLNVHYELQRRLRWNRICCAPPSREPVRRL